MSQKPEGLVAYEIALPHVEYLSREFDDLLVRLDAHDVREDRRGRHREIVNLNVTFHDIPGAIFFTSRTRPFADLGYIPAQLAWYAKGRQLMMGQEKYRPKMWARVTDDLEAQAKLDSRAAPHFDLHSNYGEYVFREEQLHVAIKRLVKDPSTRQAVILFNRPAVQVSDTKDHICTTSLQLLVRDGKLHGITTMRSNELWDGFRYDAVFFTFLMDYVRAELNAKGRTGVTLGNYSHNAGSFHVYGDAPVKLTDSEEGLAIAFPQLKAGEGDAILKELPMLQPLAEQTAPSKGLSTLCNTNNDWAHYHTLVNMLFNAARTL